MPDATLDEPVILFDHIVKYLDLAVWILAGHPNRLRILFTSRMPAAFAPLLSMTILLGFADARYTNQKDDGYTETGSSANATVGDVTTEVIEARLGVEAVAELANGGFLTGQVSGVVRRDVGDSDTDVTVFSTTETLIFASNDFAGGSLAVGYEKDVVQNMLLEVSVEQEIGGNAQGPFARIGLQWSF